MEHKTIKFNIKQFLEDYMYCIESGDSDGKEVLTSKFKRVYNSSNSNIKIGIKSFIVKSEFAKTYTEIEDLMSAF